MRAQRFLQLLLLPILLTACSRGSVTVPAGDEKVQVTTLLSTFASLCEFRELAESGRNSDAERLFNDEIHSGLHLLAAAVAEVDRAASGRLLEAKQKVEANLRGPPNPERDSELLSATSKLVIESQAALERLSIENSRC